MWNPNNLGKRSKLNSAALLHVLMQTESSQLDSLSALARPELPFWGRKRSNRGIEAAANGQHKPMVTV
jgi:hypothetical protein